VDARAAYCCPRDLTWHVPPQLGHAPQSTLIYSIYGTFTGAQELTAGRRAQIAQSEKNATTGATSRKVASRSR
jgi:hypothetical protein